MRDTKGREDKERKVEMEEEIPFIALMARTLGRLGFINMRKARKHAPKLSARRNCVFDTSEDKTCKAENKNKQKRQRKRKGGEERGLLIPCGADLGIPEAD